MTRPLAVLAFASGLLALAAAGTPASPPRTPERVESLRKRMLTHDQYRKLRDEWAGYAKAHPDDPVGWAQLARAANYAGDSCAAVVRYAERAYRVGPRNVDALATLGAWKWAAYCDGQPDDARQAIRLLEQALELDPELDDPHIRLWVMRLSKGQATANAELTSLLDRGHIPEPLVDYGYNLLVGLEPNAILLTNGDNDTVPLIALQAARGFRTDVTVVNLSMLELGWFRRMLRQGRQPVPVPLLSATPYTGSTEAVRGLIDQLARTGWKRPLYAACTVNLHGHPIPNRLSLEGIVYRVLPKAAHGSATGTEDTYVGGTDMEANPTRLAQNLEHVYRMQSATSPGLDWEAWSSVGTLMLNYVAADFQLAMARAKAGDLAAAGATMDRALTLGEYHRSEWQAQLVNQWSAWDPKSPDLARWKRKLKM